MAVTKDSGLVVEAQRLTTFPSLSMRNFSDQTLGHFLSMFALGLTIVPFSIPVSIFLVVLVNQYKESDRRLTSFSVQLSRIFGF